MRDEGGKGSIFPHPSSLIPHPSSLLLMMDTPRTIQWVGGADGFRDEDIDYAQRLYAAGVETELHVYPGAPHGVALFAATEVARRYTADQEDWLRRQLERLA